MFSLFKSRYYLKDLIPNHYIDIHNHLLPGIDDGAKTIEETKMLVSGMKKINIAGAIATPHTFAKYWNNTSTSISNAYNIATGSEEEKSFLKGYASEYMLDKTLIERVNNEKLLCLHDSYILVELSLVSCPLDLYEMLFELKCKDYKIIIAHPERYFYFHKHIDKFEKLKSFGVYFQLNLLSLTGYYGREVQKTAERLIEKNLYDFTGTDIHNEEQMNQFSTESVHFNKNKIGDLMQNNSIFYKE
jgi:protein-tyrosine phosphatase